MITAPLPPRTLEEQLRTSWTGSQAAFLSDEGEHGKAPYSECAMHAQIAGKTITRYALFMDRGASYVTWAQVIVESRVSDGLPSEVLSWDIRRKHNASDTLPHID
jgi:hypothetical protein